MGRAITTQQGNFKEPRKWTPVRIEGITDITANHQTGDKPPKLALQVELATPDSSYTKNLLIWIRFDLDKDGIMEESIEVKKLFKFLDAVKYNAKVNNVLVGGFNNKGQWENLKGELINPDEIADDIYTHICNTFGFVEYQFLAFYYKEKEKSYQAGGVTKSGRMLTVYPELIAMGPKQQKDIEWAEKRMLGSVQRGYLPADMFKDEEVVTQQTTTTSPGASGGYTI